jgi:hypothetical protein
MGKYQKRKEKIAMICRPVVSMSSMIKMGERFGACVTYRVPGQLDDYGAEEERNPRVGPCGPFSCLVERALADEHGHCLLDEIAEYGEEDVDTHHLDKQATPRVLAIDLRQADE